MLLAVLPLLAGCGPEREMTIQGEQARIVVEHRLGVRLPLGIVVQRCHSQNSFRDSFVYAKLICSQRALDEVVAALHEVEESASGGEAVPPRDLPWFSLPSGSTEKTVRRRCNQWFEMYIGSLVGGRRTVLLRANGGVPSS